MRFKHFNSPGYQLHLNFFCCSGLVGFDGRFEIHETSRITEARDFKEVDQITPFLGAISDLLCSEEESAPVTNAFALYKNVSPDVLRDRSTRPWTAARITEIENQFENTSCCHFRSIWPISEISSPN